MNTSAVAAGPVPELPAPPLAPPARAGGASQRARQRRAARKADHASARSAGAADAAAQPEPSPPLAPMARTLPAPVVGAVKLAGPGPVPENIGAAAARAATEAERANTKGARMSLVSSQASRAADLPESADGAG